MSLDIQDRIRKLLALSKSDNVHEAAAALARAHALMERHRITEEMLRAESGAAQESPELHSEPLYARERIGDWRTRLGSVLCDANGVFLWIGRDAFGRAALKLVGTQSNALRVRQLWEYCESEVERLAKHHCKGSGKTYGNNFRLGCVDAIRDAIRAERERVRETMRSELVNNSTALVALENAIARIADDGRNASALAHSKMRFGSARGYSSRSDSNARAHGRAAGAGIYSGAQRNAPSVSGGGRRQLT